MNKTLARKRRAKRTKAIIAQSKKPRLVVYRSSEHLYAQIVVKTLNGDQVVTTASTVDKSFNGTLEGTKTEKATKVGKLIAERALDNGCNDVAFDRNGYMYHGRVKALADSAREAGLIF